jgi:hypothetical protein
MKHKVPRVSHFLSSFLLNYSREQEVNSMPIVIKAIATKQKQTKHFYTMKNALDIFNFHMRTIYSILPG